MKKLKDVAFSLDPSPCSGCHWNVRHWRNWNLHLLHGSIKSIASINCTHLKEKGLHISACLRIANFLASNGGIDRFTGRQHCLHNTVRLEHERCSRNYRRLEKLLTLARNRRLCMASMTYVMLMRLVCFWICNLKRLYLFEEIFCHGGIKSKQWVTGLLTSNASDNDKLPPLVTGKYKSPCWFKNVKRLPTKYEANTNSWMTTSMFEGCIMQLDSGC
jgi:hypothetical protein